MPEESFVLVSLKEKDAKELAQVISNDSCRKILDFMSKRKDATETELADALNIPISTVHYNLQHLLKSGLIKADEFHYSKRGKEVNHYSLSNKFVIIAPKEVSEGFREKLKKILPMGIVAVVGAGAIQLFSMFSGAKMRVFSAPAPNLAAGGNLVTESASEAMEQSASLGAEIARTKATDALANLTNATDAAAPHAIPAFQNIALWFLAGAMAVIAVYLIVEAIRGRK